MVQKDNEDKYNGNINTTNPFDFIDRVVGALAMTVLIAGIGVSIYMFKKK